MHSGECFYLFCVCRWENSVCVMRPEAAASNKLNDSPYTRARSASSQPEALARSIYKQPRFSSPGVVCQTVTSSGRIVVVSAR